MSPEPKLVTERLQLRPFHAGDGEDFARMNADPAVMEFFPAILARDDSDQLLEKIRTHFTTHGFGLLAVEARESGDFLGFTGLSIPPFAADFTPCVEIGWRFARAAWGKGYASEAARACLAWGFETLDLSEILSFTSVTNLRSIGVMERIGMRKIGEFDHPNLDPGHRLERHVLYRMARFDGRD